MTVIINEVEVDVAAGAAPPAPGSAPVVRHPPPLPPQELRDVLRREAERQARLRAH